MKHRYAPVAGATRSASRWRALMVLLVGLAGATGTAAAAAGAGAAPDDDAAPRAALTIAAVGDVMLGSDYPEDRLADDDGAGYLAEAAPFLRAADLAFANHEGALVDGGEPEKLCTGTCWFFRSPTRYAAHLRDAGIDLVSLANNHARDFGETGRDSTMAALDAVGIAHSGVVGDVASVTRNGLAVAMIAFAPNPGAHSLLDIGEAARLTGRLAARHDIVVVSFHGGGEGLDALNVGEEMETYLGEDRGELRRFAHAVVDAGADLVIGHGPHVPRGLELYAGRLIAYSLGNFATYYGISVAGLKGLAPLLEVALAEDGAFLGGRLVSMRQVRPYGPRPDPSGEAFALMARLSREDFGAGAPRFVAPDRLLP